MVAMVVATVEMVVVVVVMVPMEMIAMLGIAGPSSRFFSCSFRNHASFELADVFSFW